MSLALIRCGVLTRPTSLWLIVLFTLWRLSTTQDTRFCLDVLEEAVEQYGTPDIFNTDQGNQFTSLPWACELNRQDIKISMDGKQGLLDGQCVHLATVAIIKIPMHLFECIRHDP